MGKWFASSHSIAFKSGLCSQSVRHSIPVGAAEKTVGEHRIDIVGRWQQCHAVVEKKLIFEFGPALGCANGLWETGEFQRGLGRQAGDPDARRNIIQNRISRSTHFPKLTHSGRVPLVTDRALSINFIRSHVLPIWVQGFMQIHGFVTIAQTGKLLVSTHKQQYIKREVAYHLGSLCRDLNIGSLRDEDAFNGGEWNFVNIMQDLKTLSLRGAEDVEYTAVLSSDVSMSMKVLISGGSRAEICLPFVIFHNSSRSFPIRCLLDNVLGLSYRSGWKG